MSRTVLRAAAAVLALICLAFLVAMFVFAFTAALRPGGPDPEADAAGVAMVGAFLFGGGAVMALVASE